MSINRFPILGCSLLLLLASFSAAQTISSLELERELAIIARGDFIPVCLILSEQAKFNELYPRVINLPKAQRRSAVISELQGLAKRIQASLLKDLTNLAEAGKVRGIRALWISNVVVAQVEADELMNLIKRHPEVERALWDPPRPFPEIPDGHAPDAAPQHTDQISWGVQDIQAPQVWSLGYQGEGVLIATIDTGVDYTHPDLADHIWVNPGEDLNGNGIVDSSDWNGVDDDGNGYVDDLRGWAMDLNSPEVMDLDGNGTATAGIIVGDGSGGEATGVAPLATLMILKNEGGAESAYWEAQQYAILMGADAISSSLSYKWVYLPRPDYAVMRQNTDMELAAGLIHCNAIGNEGNQQSSNPIPFNIAAPGNCPPPWLHPDQTLIGDVSAVLGSGAYGADYQIKDYSGVGPAAWYLRDILALDPGYPWQASWPTEYNDYPYQNAQSLGLLKPDLAAPTDVLTTALGGGYLPGFGGTPAAAAHTGGAICLLLSANPDATPETIARILMTTAIDMGLPGKDNIWGAGRLNVYNAVVELLSEISGTLTGTVSDSSTGEPIHEAAVDLPELQLWTQTDSSGHFLLPGIPPGTYDVRFAAAGFDTLILPAISFSVSVTETINVVLVRQPEAVEQPTPTTPPREFRLGQNYPNPFNSQTVIPLELPQRSHVKIELFNLRGQNLGTIYEGIENAGWPKISYDASALSSGIYFCRVIAEGLERSGKFQSTNKMLLLK